MFPVEEIARRVGGELLRGVGGAPARAIHDSRLVLAGDLFVALRGRRTDGHAHLAEAYARGACAALVRRSSPLPDGASNVVVVDDPLVALQQLATAWRSELSATFVAITGSNGKSTVKALLAHLLAPVATTYASPHNYNTEIGLPLALLAMPPDARVGVFELGAERPGDIAVLARILCPNVGIVTGVGASHLDGLGTVAAVATEKWSLVSALPSDGVAIVNADSEPLRVRAASSVVETITVGVLHGNQRGRIVWSVPTLRVAWAGENEEVECSLLGEHNATNLLLAMTAAARLGGDPPTIRGQAATFRPIPHRLSPIKTRDGLILDDTYNANPASTAAALRVLASMGGDSIRRTFVFGEMRGLGSESRRFHREALQLALSLPIDRILPIGDDAVAVCQETQDARIAIVPPADLPGVLRGGGADQAILIKGSRALGLESLVERLRGD